MQDYRIGVLLSAYNGEKYITQQVKSIMNQNNKDHITLLIRNDGSTDNTYNVLNDLSKEYSNIRIINGPNIGLIASFFKLLEIALKKYDFDYYSFSDQDDYWMEDKLEQAVKALNTEDEATPILYGCRSVVVDDNLKPTGFMTQSQKCDLSFYNTAIQNIVIGHNQVLNKKLAEILVNKKQNFSNIYSQDLWIENVAAVAGKIIFDNSPHTFYRMHGDNQLGYGKGKLDRLSSHIKRLFKKEPQKMALQLKYFVDCYEDFLSLSQKKEINDFISSQCNLHSRIKYMKKSKLYRQDEKETVSFKLLYILGSYNL